MTILPVLIYVALIAGWVAAWLFWIFDGEIRHFIYAYLAPKSWRNDRERSEIMCMTSDDIEMFLATEAGGPKFLSGVLSCPGCSSAWVSASGVVLLYASLGLLPWLEYALAPLVWASAAYLGHRIHHYA